MKTRVKEKVQAQPLPQKECSHYWIIEVANGPASRGRCKYCGVTKEFFNAFPAFNPLRKNSNPLNFPELPQVEVAEDNTTSAKR